MKYRLLNRIYAFIHGYFWLPCPICGQYFGGHEWKTDSPNAFVQLADDTGGTGICPDCTLKNIASKYVADNNDNVYLKPSDKDNLKK